MSSSSIIVVANALRLHNGEQTPSDLRAPNLVEVTS